MLRFPPALFAIRFGPRTIHTRKMKRLMRRTDRILFAAAALLIPAYFFLLVRPSLGAFFTRDDLMNLYRSWSFPAGLLVKANVLFFWASPFYRPLPSLWYRVVFHFAGFHALPFHSVYPLG